MTKPHILPPATEVEEHFSQLVAGVQDYAIFMLSPEGFVKTWNAGAQRFKGYAPDEIIGHHFSEFYMAEAQRARWPQQELELAVQQGRFEDEGWRVRKDGSRFWANVVITPLWAPDSALRGFLKITRDLSERKAADEALRRSEERFRILVSGVKDYAIFMLDPEGRIISWNQGAERIKGYAASEIIGQHFSVFYPTKDVENGKPERELCEARDKGSVEDEGWRVKKDRSLFWANVVITALYNDEKRLLGYAKVTRDLTEKRLVYELEVADRHKNDFLAMLAHELRNPLAPISNGLQLLKLPNIDDSMVRQTIEMMERQMSHVVRLVDDLLDVSRIILGKTNYKQVPVDLAAVIQQATEETHPAMDAGGHELMLSLPARPLIVNGDELRLAQAISNILSNAAKYSSQPSQIWLSVARQQDNAVIKVKDSGIGIAPELLLRIFNLFVQADDTLDRARGGLGIGLSLVKRIVEQHGGTVSAASPGLGMGSEFTITLPLSRKTVASPDSRPPSRPVLDRYRILVVDDNADAALTLTALLRAWGHEVQTAFNGPAALEMVPHFHPEVILLDIGLPGMSGYEVARRLRGEADGEEMLIAALTGYGQDADREQSIAAGCDLHLTKPPDPKFLESLLSSPIQRERFLKSNHEQN